MERLQKIRQKIVTIEQFLSLHSDLSEKKVVFTNGCFDVLHLGHVEYLSEASELGDILVVGLNSDASVKRLKGADRPINSEHARATLLAALQFVNFVIIFKEDTPLQLIGKIVPHILVKGGDYAISEIVGADIVTKNGGLVKTIPLTEGFSTTNILNHIQ